MRLKDVIAASTVNAAKALNRPQLGTFKSGSVGDASILELREGQFPLEDVRGEVVTANERLFARGVVIAGKWWHSTEN
jgi:dihydroorotase